MDSKKILETLRELLSSPKIFSEFDEFDWFGLLSFTAVIEDGLVELQTKFKRNRWIILGKIIYIHIGTLGTSLRPCVWF